MLFPKGLKLRSPLLVLLTQKCVGIANVPTTITPVNPTSRSSTAKFIKEERKFASVSPESLTMRPEDEWVKNVTTENNQ